MEEKAGFLVSITFYHPLKNQTKTRSYRLRNLRGNTLAQKIDYADKILEGLVEQLRYLSGEHGISKGLVKVNGKARIEHSYTERFPAPSTHDYLDAVLTMQFRRTGLVSIADGSMHGATGLKTIDIPCRYVSPLRQQGTRTAKHNDPIFQQFCRRFAQEGNLSLDTGHESWGTLVHTKFKMLATVNKVNRRKTVTEQKVAKPKAAKGMSIYLIHLHDDVYKIGQSKNPQSRLAAMQTSSPYKLSLVHSFPADNANQAESILHQHLSKYRLEGEWFKLPPEVCHVIKQIDMYRKHKFWTRGRAIDLDTRGIPLQK